MNYPVTKKAVREYESVANVEMKNGKMKFILPFFILPDDKKRPLGINFSLTTLPC